MLKSSINSFKDPADYDLLRVSTARNFTQLCEILAGSGSSLDKIGAIDYMLERLVPVKLPSGSELINPESSSLAYLQAVKKQLICDKHELEAGIWLRGPEESAILYKRLFKDVIGPEAEDYQRRWKDSYSACMERGGPWKHHTCGEVFPMPPSYPPVCPKCDSGGWNRLLDAYHSEKQDGYKKLKEQIAAAGDERPVESFSPSGEWNHVCGSCGGPAYQGFNMIACKNGCS